MIALQLGREYKLSLAEIYNVFQDSRIVSYSKSICIIEENDIELFRKKLNMMGGVIKAIKLQEGYKGNPETFIILDGEKHIGKFRYGISVFGSPKLKQILLKTKKILKQNSISARFINKNFSNLSSAGILGEKLLQSNSDYTIIEIDNTEYFGRTFWVQDIEKYGKRDFGKSRNMQVGMLPPKLAQMLINFSAGSKIYDPFCGLGTILIESAIAGNEEVYGSDISEENIETSKKNISFTRKEFDTNIKTSMFEVLDAKGISSSPFLKKSDVIVTEGYLGEIFHKYSITEEKIQKEKEKLLDIYTYFFEGLSRAHYSGTIVICFPFWSVRGKYHYFDEIYSLLKKYTKNLPLLPRLEDTKHTKYGSLLYKRDDQIVGREIFKLKLIKR